jgi:hypothetical protein
MSNVLLEIVSIAASPFIIAVNNSPSVGMALDFNAIISVA